MTTTPPGRRLQFPVGPAPARPDGSPPLAVTGSCELCGGRGWKFLILRRSPASAGLVSERASRTRARVGCLACAGTGTPQAA
ncbi:MAG TPA: hypothetical protein VGL63_00400 [Streptosporangiaceae bacterium]